MTPGALGSEREISFRDRSWEDDAFFNAVSNIPTFHWIFFVSIIKFYLHIMSSLEDDNTMSFD